VQSSWGGEWSSFQPPGELGSMCNWEKAAPILGVEGAEFSTLTWFVQSSVGGTRGLVAPLTKQVETYGVVRLRYIYKTTKGSASCEGGGRATDKIDPGNVPGKD